MAWRCAPWGMVLVPWLALAPAALAHPDHAQPPATPAGLRAPGYGSLGFQAPAPGTYSLPVIGPAADGAVVDAEGRSRRLHDLFRGRTVLLSYIYTGCNDVNGCPLATWVLGRVQQPVAANPALRDRVRLLSVSFDPARDTPQAMQEYGARFRAPGFDWHFLAPPGNTELRTLLDAYGQWTMPERDAAGNVTGAVAHLLRVYLIDDQGRIRNIYNANFLHPDILVNDLLTVIGAEN